MSYALKTEKQNELNIIYGGASKEEIERNENIGQTHLYIDGNSYFINIYDEYDRQRLKNHLGVPEYEFFQEMTGNKNWVLYNPKHYKVDKDWDNDKILKFNNIDYDGAPIEIPINASSLVGMFLWTSIPENIKFSEKLFNLDNIVDLSLMFAGTRFPRDEKGHFIQIDLSPCFKTKKVLQTRYMFYKTVLPKYFNKFFELLDTSTTINLEYMFSQTIISDELVIDISIDNAINVNHMFFNTSGNYKLGPKFKLPKNCNTDYMWDKLDPQQYK